MPALQIRKHSFSGDALQNGRYHNQERPNAKYQIIKIILRESLFGHNEYSLTIVFAACHACTGRHDRITNHFCYKAMNRITTSL